MSVRIRSAVVLASLAMAIDARAAPRLTVGPVAGDPGARLPAQLAASLCVRFECVLWPAVSTRGRPDLQKLRRERVDGLLLGAVARRDAGASVALTLRAGAEPEALRWELPLDADGRLSAAALRTVERDLLARLPPPPPTATPPRAPPARVAPAPRPAPIPTPAPVRPAAPAPDPAPTPPPAAAAASAPAPAVAATPAPAQAPVRTAEERRDAPTLGAIELGGFWARRTLGYGGLAPSAATLRGFEAGSIGGLCAGLELFPLARLGPWPGGLGLTAAYERAVGLHTTSPAGDRRPTDLSRLRVGAAWRSPPLGAARLALTPSVAYATWRVAVRPPIDGLPDADLSGVRLGLAAAAPIGRVRLHAEAAWVRWVTARDLVRGQPVFFPGGSAWGLEGEAGLEVALAGPISARLAAAHSVTRYTLDADPAGRYAASSARDAVTTVRTTLRATY